METVVTVDGVNKTLKLGLRYNEVAGYWTMAVIDAITGAVLLDSIPLLTGVYPAANILKQFAYLGIGSAYILKTSNVALDYPDDTDLGSDFVLLWSDSLNV